MATFYTGYGNQTYTQMETVNDGVMSFGQATFNWAAPGYYHSGNVYFLDGFNAVKPMAPSVIDMKKVYNYLNNLPTSIKERSTNLFYDMGVTSSSARSFDSMEDYNAYFAEAYPGSIEQYSQGFYWITGGSLDEGGIAIRLNFSNGYMGLVWFYGATYDSQTEKYFYYIDTLSLEHYTRLDYLFFNMRWFRNTDDYTVDSPYQNGTMNRCDVCFGSYQDCPFLWNEISSEGIPIPIYAVGDRHVESASNMSELQSYWLTDFTSFEGKPQPTQHDTWIRALQYRYAGQYHNIAYFFDRPDNGGRYTFMTDDTNWKKGAGGQGGGSGRKQGGGGKNDKAFESDSIGIPALPGTDAARAGLFGIYHITPQNLADFNAWLWDNNIFQTIIKNWASPLENVVMLGTVPFNNFIEHSSQLGLGNRKTTISCYKLDQAMYEFDCGWIDIDEPYFTYADYEPYTQYWVYLPYIGVQSINPDDVAMGGRLHVVYHFDVFSGACVVYLECEANGNTNVLATYNGNILSQYPIAGSNYMQMYQTVANSVVGLQSSVVGAATSAATGNGMGVVNSVAGGATGINQGIVNTLSSKPSYGRTGSISNIVGALSIKTPYLIKALPEVVEPTLFNSQNGYVSNLTTRISSQAGGYITADVNNTMLSDIKASDDEKNEIKALLSQGIYV